MSRFEVALTLMAFLLFSAFVFGSNGYDWDFFFSINEVDLRAWLNDGQIPLWSYQLCAGSSRLGDPQAFGLSPLFLPVILFGSILGTKIVVLLSFGGGFWALRSIGLMFTRDKVIPGTISALSLCTLLSNFFLWHMHVGHVTFALMNIIFIFLFYFLKAAIEKFGPKDGIILSLVSYSYFSGGFSASFIYLLFPILISSVPVLIYRIYAKENRASLFRFCFTFCLGALAAGYKIWGVFDYQLLFPRTIHERDTDYQNIFQFLHSQLVPTLNSDFITGGNSTVWGIWEYSSFNMTTLVLAILFLMRPSFDFLSHVDKSIRLWLYFLIAVGISFFISPESPMSLSYWANFFLKDSIRVFSRFQIVWILIIFVLVVLILKSIGNQNRLNRAIWFVAVPITFLNMLTFDGLSLSALQSVLRLPSQKHERINQLDWVPEHPQSIRIMYPSITQGRIALNCYQPLNRPIALTSELESQRPTGLHLVSETTEPNCLLNTGVTQNEIFIHSTCPIGTCLSLNDLNPYAVMPDNVEYFPNKNRWCISH